MIINHSLPPCAEPSQRLAIVEEVMPDREGVVQVVKLRTSKGPLLRPIQKQKDELDVRC